MSLESNVAGIRFCTAPLSLLSCSLLLVYWALYCTFHNHQSVFTLSLRHANELSEVLEAINQERIKQPPFVHPQLIQERFGAKMSSGR